MCLHNHRWGLSCHALSKYCDKCPCGAGTCSLPSSVRASFQLWEEEPILSERKRLGTVAVPEVWCPVDPEHPWASCHLVQEGTLMPLGWTRG